jgi:hypothetical protein
MEPGVSRPGGDLGSLALIGGSAIRGAMRSEQAITAKARSTDLQIRRNGQGVQDRPGVATCRVDVPGWLVRIKWFSSGWQQLAAVRLATRPLPY